MELVFNKEHKDTFNLIKIGKKRVETRAYKKEYANIQKGETVTFLCDGESFKRKVVATHHFKSIDELLKHYKPEEIHQTYTSKQEIVDLYTSFPGYLERIKEGGVFSFELMEESEDVLASFDYALPKDCIRGEPVNPRHNAKLLVYDTKTDTITDDVFLNLYKYVPEDSVLVLNDTQVLPVRLQAYKKTGGKVEIFLLMNEEAEGGLYKALINTKSDIGTHYYIQDDIFFTVLEQDGPTFYVRPHGMSVQEIIRTFGVTPLPNYIETTLTEEVLRTRYQTVFAKEVTGKGSVAAPTASLHFTDEVFKHLEEKHIKKAFVTLHVGRGTFAPLREEMIRDKKLHAEYYELHEDTVEILAKAKEERRAIVVVGTTAMRTLESFAKTGNPKGETTIFIQDPHTFTYGDAFVTNFHLPKTSLMMLVDAFLKDKGAKRDILSLYKYAIDNGYSFYSFGDAMIIL